MAQLRQTAKVGLHNALASAIKLNTKNLPAISKIAQQNLQILQTPQIQQYTIELPTYNRTNVKEGIVHLGVGGFHRAHLGVYQDDLMEQHGVIDWAICGVGLQPFDAAMRDALIPQNGLFTLVERSAAGSRARVIGSITSYLFAPDSPQTVICKMAHDDTRIVSMTVTESGYFYNENTHQLEADHPDIAADLKGDLEVPRTTYGYLFASLQKRFNAGKLPYTVLSCDNMQGNGTITSNMLNTFAKFRSPKVADWITEHGAFPNSMVDRITPRTTDADKQNLENVFGIQDAWPVVTEPFKQWVVEDKFALGRPAFEKVGVRVVKNKHEVEEFEAHKLRLLNASHTAMAYMAYLGGFEYVHEVIENPVFNSFIRNMMHEEVQPLLPSIPGVDINEYVDKLMERFANPTIMDQISRLTLNGSNKIPQFIMPSIAEQIMANTHHLRRLTLVVASWFRYLHGVDEKGRAYHIDDPLAEDLKARALQGGSNAYPLIGVKNLFGDDLRKDKIFMDELAAALKSLHEEGALATLAKYA